MGTRLTFNTTFHPQTYGHFKQVIQISKGMLRVYAMDFQGNLDTELPLSKFSHDNNYDQAMIDMTPYEVHLYLKMRITITLV